MAKVKKSAGLTGVRNVKGSKAKTPARASRSKAKIPKGAARTKKGGRQSMQKVATKKKTPRKGKLASLPVKKGRPAPPAPVVQVAVRELDPQRKCGAGTSVQFLYRVDETVDGRSTAHLVFFDRHGWYCEHGRTCPAVGHARKRNGQLARVS